METAITNFVQQGMKVVVLANGFFLRPHVQRWRDARGRSLVRFEKPWGGRSFGDRVGPLILSGARSPGLRDVRQRRDLDRRIFQHGHAICQAAREVDALVIADYRDRAWGHAHRGRQDRLYRSVYERHSCHLRKRGSSCSLLGCRLITVSPRARGVVEGA